MAGTWKLEGTVGSAPALPPLKTSAGCLLNSTARTIFGNAQTIETEDGIRIPALGPYSSRGEYEHAFTLESASGEFIPLTPTACDWIIRAIEFSRAPAKREPPRSQCTREPSRPLLRFGCDEILDCSS
jgi:hypothetical protein